MFTLSDKKRTKNLQRRKKKDLRGESHESEGIIREGVCAIDCMEAETSRGHLRLREGPVRRTESASPLCLSLSHIPSHAGEFRDKQDKW